jgi:hypothetical protein
MYPGDWRHHGLGVRLVKYKGDFTPEKASEVVTEEISVWEQLFGLVRGEPQIRDMEIAS